MKKNYLKLALVISIYFMYGCATQSGFQYDVKKVNKSYQYLSDNVNDEEYDEIDVSRAEQHIDILTSFLEKHPISPKDEVSLRHARAKAIYAVNTVHFLNEEEVNAEQDDIAVGDIKFVVKNNRDPYKAKRFYRDAGQIIRHLTDNKALAFYYYAKCAELDEGSCQNIIAHGFFDGSFEVPANIKESIYWHTRAYRTQLNYGCAGIYSSSSLVHIAFLFPELSDENWKEWLKRKNELKKQMGNNFRQKYCGFSPEDHFSDYVIHMLNGEKNTKLLQLAIASSSSSIQQKMYQALLESNDLDLAYSFFLNRSLSSKEPLCTSALDLLLVSKHVKNNSVRKNLELYFSNLENSECRFSRTVIKYLEKDNTEDTNEVFKKVDA